METHKFIRRPFYVDAVRVTSANMQEVAAWCKGAVKNSKPDGDLEKGRTAEKFIEVPVYRPMNDRQKMAFVGDWILFANKGYKVYTNIAFEKTFDAVRIEVPQEVIDRVSGRDSVTGRFVDKEYVEEHPDTTTTETIHTPADFSGGQDIDDPEEVTTVQTPPNKASGPYVPPRVESFPPAPKLEVREEPVEGTETTKNVIEPSGE